MVKYVLGMSSTFWWFLGLFFVLLEHTPNVLFFCDLLGLDRERKIYTFRWPSVVNMLIG